MLVARGQRQAVLLCDGSNPDVVFRNWTAFYSQAFLNLAVVLGSHPIAIHDLDGSRELLDSGQVGSGMGGLVRTIVKLA